MNIRTIAPLPRCEWSCLLLPDQLGARNLDAASACFAQDACLLTPDGTAVHGRSRIRPVLAQLISAHPDIDVGPRSVLVAGDVALARERWTIRVDGVEGSRFEQISRPTLVMQQIEGVWKLQIAAPWERAK